MGDIRLGEPARRVVKEYGARRGSFGRKPDRQGYYRLHGSDVEVDFENGRVVNILFSTSYYRTRSGFGVGSKIPFGPCVKTWTHRCGHVWHGFVWNEVYKAEVCGCWAKVGTRKRSLRPSVENFLRPWTQIFVRRGRVASFYFSLHYVD